MKALRVLLIIVAAVVAFAGPAIAAASDLTMKGPAGYQAWIAAHPDLMRPAATPAGEAATWRLDRALLARVNREVNARMPWRPDEAGDVWGDGSDCEDAAIAKLEVLLAAGVPRWELRLAAWRVPGGSGGHAVLIAANRYVLDQRRLTLYRLHDLPFSVIFWEAGAGLWEPAFVTRITPAPTGRRHTGTPSLPEK